MPIPATRAGQHDRDGAHHSPDAAAATSKPRAGIATCTGRLVRSDALSAVADVWWPHAARGGGGAGHAGTAAAQVN